MLTPARQIARAAGTVMAAIVFSQVMGLARGILVAQSYPAALLDSFYAANRVSETLFTLLAAGALGSAFLPTFKGMLVREEKAAAWKLASALANLVTLSLSLLAVIAAWFAPQIVRYLLAPGLYENYILYHLTIDLLRIQLASAVLFGLGGLVVGILNAHQVFFIPQITAGMYQLGQIFGVLVLHRWLGIYGLAWGVVLGAALYLLVQIPVLQKQKGVYTLTLGLKDAATRKVIALMGPRVLGAGVVQLNFWVNAALASQMPSGSLTGLSYGFALMLMAQAAIAQSVAIAAMPTFSAQFALGQAKEMRLALAAALRGVLLFSLPASLGLMLLAKPLVALLYERGEFGSASTEAVAWALLWYAAGMVGHSLLEVLTRAYYARQDTQTPVVVGAAAMSLNVLLSFLFSGVFSHLGWMPHGGLALANSAATGLEAAVLLWLLRGRLGGLEGRSLLKGGAQMGAAALGMAIGLLGWNQVSAGWGTWIQALGGVALGAGIYAGLGILFHIPEVDAVVGVLRRRVQGR